MDHCLAQRLEDCNHGALLQTTTVAHDNVLGLRLWADFAVPPEERIVASLSWDNEEKKPWG